MGKGLEGLIMGFLECLILCGHLILLVKHEIETFLNRFELVVEILLKSINSGKELP